MAKIYNHFQELIGNTPLFRLQNFERKNNLSAQILAKLEYFNPTGSVKVEPTSGNTGVGLAAVAAARGYEIIIAMPETMSIERRKILQAYGAQLVLTAGAQGMKGVIAKAKELAAQIPNSFIPSQFTNPANPECHKLTTARETFSHAGIIRFQGQTMTYVPGESPCYRCIFNEPPPKDAVPTCRQAGVMGGVIGTLQATEALKYILGVELLTGYLLAFDALTVTFRKVKIPHNRRCKIFGEQPMIVEFVDYEQPTCSFGA